MAAVRTPWRDFPNIAVHTTIAALKAHPAYNDAKIGDLRAAMALVRELANPALFKRATDFVVPVVQLDHEQRWNALPLALADQISRLNGAKLLPSIVQENVVPHTGADSISRLLNQPRFAGKVPKGSYLVVDDVVTLGSTIANLRGYIESNGGRVVAATTLGAAIFSTKLTPEGGLVPAIKRRFQNDISILPEQLGFSPECLTNKEAHFVNGLRNLIALRDPQAPTHRIIRPEGGIRL